MVNEGFLPVLGVLLVIGFFIGVAVIGLTIYSAVLEHRREYGVLKAVGARTRQMLVVVAVQAMFSAAAGYVVGVGVVAAGGARGRAVGAAVHHRIQSVDVALVGVAAVLMGLIAAVVPLRRIARVDPAVVFRVVSGQRGLLAARTTSSKSFGHGAGRRSRRSTTCDLRLDPGEVALIVGPSGSGKTTLLMIAGAMLTPTTGEVEPARARR